MGTLLDRYRQVDSLGVGARSSILLVKDDRDGQLYALKRVVRRSSLDDRIIEQVEAEYEVSRRFDHPVLRRSFTLKRVRKWLRLVEVQLLMEYFPGRNLEEHVTHATLPQLVQIFLKVAQGLHALHQMRYVHADIKPNNILIDPQTSEVKIIDFGQSCALGAVKERIQGTPGYIAPEQVRRLPLDQRTDVFNLGATMYQMLTGRSYPTLLPDEKMRPGQKLDHSHNGRNVKAPHEHSDQIPLVLSRLVMDCCEDRMQDRPDDMRQVIGRLDMVIDILRKNGTQWHPTQPEAPTRADIDATGSAPWRRDQQPAPGMDKP